MKKVGIVLGILILIILIGYIVLKYFMNGYAEKVQINMQYDNEIKPKHKNILDYTAFESDLEKLSNKDICNLETLILDKSIDEIQDSIINGYLSYEKLVLFYISRIKEYDKYYNTIIQLNDKALSKAREIDEKIKNNEDIGDLFGVVVLLKDNISDKDMNTTAGAYALKDLTTNRDAFVVSKLKNQDAIILGKANMSEWANFMSMSSSNGFSVLGGQTKNAYGRYDVGGSSSGSSAAVALNFSTITLGSETCGSMIYPASQNSVVGLKPTLGLLSRDLIIPISEAQDTAGIMGKTVKDVCKVFNTVLVEDKNDPLSKNIENFNIRELCKPLDANYLKGKRIGFLNSNKYNNAKVKEELIKLGAEIIEIDLPKEANSVDMITVLNYGIVNDVQSYLNNPDVNTKYKTLEEILNFNKEDKENRMPYGVGLWKDALKQNKSKEDYEKIVNTNMNICKNIIDTLLKDNKLDAIVSFSNDLSGVYAPATYPALTVPAGYTKDGEPFGITFVGSLNDDTKLLNLGYSYEQGTKHRKTPCINK